MNIYIFLLVLKKIINIINNFKKILSQIKIYEDILSVRVSLIKASFGNEFGVDTMHAQCQAVKIQFYPQPTNRHFLLLQSRFFPYPSPFFAYKKSN